jgi:predicted porin
MKFITTLAAGALAAPALLAGQAHAAELYGAVRAGPTFDQSAEAGGSSISLDNGMAYGAAAGVDFGALRLEAGANRISGDVAALGLNGNATDYYADAFLEHSLGAVDVFAGAGIDRVDADASTPWGGVNGSGVGWNWAAGASYKLNDRVTLEAQVKSISVPIDFGASSNVDVTSRAATVGLRIRI